MNLYRISQSNGFLPETDPLLVLPNKFSALDSLGYELPKLLMTQKLRAKVKELPSLPVFELTSIAERERAMMLYSFIAHAYVFCAEPVSSIPENIAKPWVSLANSLGRPPVLSYASYALYNWRRIDTSKEIELGNIALLQNFWGGADEEWFILVHIDIEKRAAPSMAIIPALIEGIETKDFKKIEAAVNTVVASLKEINASMDRMPEYCDPYIYYHRVRPFIHGWKNNPSLPQGMIYEGVSTEAKFYRGETGAQSGIVPVLDAVFGITHADDPLRQYLLEMREYMPKEHRAFLEDIEKKPNLRSILKDAPTSIKDGYNQVISLIEQFRSTHLKYAASYIANQAQTSAKNSNLVGTGGTPFMKYLTKHRDETTTHKI